MYNTFPKVILSGEPIIALDSNILYNQHIYYF